MTPEKDGSIVVDMEDEVIRGATVVQGRRDDLAAAGAEAVGGALPPAKPNRAPAEKRVVEEEADAAGSRHDHRRCSSAGWRCWVVGAVAPPVVHGALHGVRAGLFRRLHGDLERHAGAAHAADECHQRDLRHHHHRRAAADQFGLPAVIMWMAAGAFRMITTINIAGGFP